LAPSLAEALAHHRKPVSRLASYGKYYSGYAMSIRRRRYQLILNRGNVVSVYREHPEHGLPDGRTLWSAVSAPPALKVAVRKATREVRRKRAP